MINACFKSEINSWKKVFKARSKTIVFFSLLMVLVISLWFSVVWEYRTVSYAVTQFVNQMEVLVEVDPALGEDQRLSFQEDIMDMEMVEDVEYWSAEQSAKFIDDQVMSGYVSFLQKSQLDIPFAPLFRVSLKSLEDKAGFERMIVDRYGDHLWLVNETWTDQSNSFAGEFVEVLSGMARFLWVQVLLLMMLVGVLNAYFGYVLLSERNKGFFWEHVFHVHVTGQFWSTWMVSVLGIFVFDSLSMMLCYIVHGQMLWLLAILLGFALCLENLILLWVGRFVAIK